MKDKVTVDSALLLQIAGFLSLVTKGYIVVPLPTGKEAADLLEKIGALLAEDDDT